MNKIVEIGYAWIPFLPHFFMNTCFGGKKFGPRRDEITEYLNKERFGKFNIQCYQKTI
jgi:hypothetical protein